MKANKKAWKALAIVCLVLVGLVTLAYVGLLLYARAPFAAYYQNATKVFRIPGIDDGLIPQGLAYDGARGIYYVSGYDNGSRPSSIYAVQGDEVKHLTVQTQSGQPFTGHSGGITYHGDYMYLAGSGNGCLYVLRYEDILSAADGDSVRICGKFDTFIGTDDAIRVSFTGSSDTHIYVGEYHKVSGYSTPDTHHFTHDGQDYGGLMAEYAYDDNAPWGIAAVPTRVISIVDLVQGMCCDANGDLYLSTSAFLDYSNIYQFDGAALAAGEAVMVGDSAVPHFFTHSGALKKSRRTPPMSEEIVMVEGKLCAISEFASNRFFIGKLCGGDYCYALDWTQY